MRKKGMDQKKLILLAGMILFTSAFTGCESKTKQISATGEEYWDESDEFETFESEEYGLRENESASGKLERTFVYIENMDMEKYTEESWNEFVEILSQVYTEYLDGADDERCDELQRELETAKARLKFLTVLDIGSPMIYKDLTMSEIVADMGTGWNLGNTFDGHTGMIPSETIWQDSLTTQQLINSVHDLGFHTVRIPITWGSMIKDEYTIDDAWISRIQDVVDYCINQDMYVIINIQNDSDPLEGWLSLDSEDMDIVYEEYEDVWRCIADRFKDYDEHLIFESMNEVSGTREGAVLETQMIMNLNQIFVNVVRATGSNNAVRWLSIPGRAADIEQIVNEKYGFTLPEDEIEGRLFVTVHSFDTAFGVEQSMDVTEYDMDRVALLSKYVTDLENRFVSQGVPVIWGAYGSVNKNNISQRAYYHEVMNYLCKNAGIVPVYWDQGWYDRGESPADYSFALIDRDTNEVIEKEVVDGIIRGYFGNEQLTSVSQIDVNPMISEITELSLSEGEIVLPLGEQIKIEYSKVPSSSRDLVLWKSSDFSVATVYNGVVVAKGPGTAEITAYSQSGSVSVSIPVTVTAKEVENPVTDIFVLEPKLYLAKGSYSWLKPEISGGDENTFLTYQSMDSSVATVSRIGKVTAVGNGETTIRICSVDGCEESVTVNVSGYEEVVEKNLKLALNVLYNDEELGYSENEVGDYILVNGDGQYTVTFDCEQNLSKKAKEAGVEGLNNLVAIYIKDYDVTDGIQMDSGLISCNIRYDSILVDGVDLTILQHEAQSALKASGIFDSNNPINAWDGSVVAEVEEENHVLNLILPEIEHPQKISITFTLSDCIFEE